jgi:hypothetical protein
MPADPYIQASKYADSKRARIQSSVIDDQLVRLVEEAYIAGYSAHLQDIAWGRDPRYERVDL